MSPERIGSLVLSISLTIQRYTTEGELPKSFPSILKDAFPKEYKITARALLTVVEAFTRLSPSMKLRQQSLHL
jgi:hypothetical protein